MTVLRPLDPAERYYWMLDRLAPMNIVAIAELDQHPSPAAVAEAVHAVQRRHPLLRARVDVVDGQPCIIEASGDVPVTVTGTDGTSWIAEIEHELDTPFAPALPFARAALYPHGDDGRSVLALVVHHSIIDGRAVVAALQQVVRHLDDPGESERPAAPLPSPLHDAFPDDLRSPRAAIGVLGTVRDERAGQADATTFPFHTREAATQSSRLDRLIVEPDAAATLRTTARAAGATVNGALASALLESTAALFPTPEDRVVNLATPTDLRARVDPPLPDDAVLLAIGLLCTPYPVSMSGNAELARTITEQTRREIDRGESHLFYRFVRAGALAVDDDGLAAFSDWVATTPQNVAVSNLGVVDHEGDPAWLRSLSFALSTTSNQLAFVAATTYRGRLVLNTATDRTKLAAELADRLALGIADRTGAHPA